VIVAVASAEDCDSIATFARKLANKLESFGLARTSERAFVSQIHERCEALTLL
jgi:hypothetical protein